MLRWSMSRGKSAVWGYRSERKKRSLRSWQSDRALTLFNFKGSKNALAKRNLVTLPSSQMGLEFAELFSEEVLDNEKPLHLKIRLRKW